jgi:hypothetical protein
MKPPKFAPLTAAKKRAAAAQFERDGFYIVPSVIPPGLLTRVRKRIAAVYAGEYETGGSPMGSKEPPTKLVKIDNAHRSDRTIFELVTHPAIGQWAAAITGAKMVQLFACQMLIKPPGSQGGVNVGWHQDQEYWDHALTGELFTAWVAISDVTAESGPMRFVPGSNHWGLQKAGDFFSDKLDEIKKRFQDKTGGTWREVAAILPPGGVSFHHRLTVHGSGENHSASPRISFAIHFRTEKSGLREGVKWQDASYLNDFADPIGSPISYRV